MHFIFNPRRFLHFHYSQIPEVCSVTENNKGNVLTGQIRFLPQFWKDWCIFLCAGSFQLIFHKTNIETKNAWIKRILQHSTFWFSCCLWKLLHARSSFSQNRFEITFPVPGKSQIGCQHKPPSNETFDVFVWFFPLFYPFALVKVTEELETLHMYIFVTGQCCSTAWVMRSCSLRSLPMNCAGFQVCTRKQTCILFELCRVSK